jgi:hypothetical protein
MRAPVVAVGDGALGFWAAVARGAELVTPAELVAGDGIAVTTAPTWVQVEKLIWGEIRQMILRARATGYVFVPTPNKTELTLGPGNYALGLSIDDSMRF